uniref:Anamorsin n=1 Tax=Xiphophorus couchianus TaxID=32473 RepID=A0A3B5MW02_9TELE
MADLGIKAGDKVLLVWTQPSTPETLKQYAEELGAAVGADGKISVENMERLSLCESIAHQFNYSTQLSVKYVLYCTEAQTMRTAEKLMSALKLSGFMSVTEVSKTELSPETLSSLRAATGYQGNTLTRVRISASKPNYEVGSSSQIKLSFGKKTQKPAEKLALDPNTKKMWMLSANDMNDDDVDLLDSDTLLDEDDLKKPDPASLKASSCGEGTGKKKACKNCTCGLAEELEQESKENQKTNLPKSACGSCYLGDAFRCASCPYLGMPAFKPGEKIVLDNNTLTDA